MFRVPVSNHPVMISRITSRFAKRRGRRGELRMLERHYDRKRQRQLVQRQPSDYVLYCLTHPEANMQFRIRPNSVGGDSLDYDSRSIESGSDYQWQF